MKINLTPEEIQKLKIMHKSERDKRTCDRIKAVLLINNGYTYKEVSEILLLDDESVRRHIEEYAIQNKLNNNFKGSEEKLNEINSNELIQHLQENIHTNVYSIIKFVKEKYNINYSASGMTNWLNCNNFSYKKPYSIPSKINLLAQEECIKLMNELKAENDLLFYADAVHPAHQSKAAYGWIYKGSKVSIQTTVKQKRVNIAGIIEINSKEITYKEDTTINTQTITTLLDKLIEKYGTTKKLNIIFDNAKYQKNPLIFDYIKDNPNIKIHYLPAYSPNLNLIERVWKFMHKIVKNNTFYEKFEDFKSSILNFFANFSDYKNDMDKLLSFKFQRMDFKIGKFAK
jgi:transposase